MDMFTYVGVNPMRQSAILGTALIVLGVAISAHGQARQPCMAVRVLDSCRVELSSGKLIRLIGLQAFPEFPSNRIRPSSFLDSLIIRKSLWREHDENLPGDFGYLWHDSLLINVELLRQGLARVWDDTVQFKYQEVFFITEHKARVAKRGNWQFATLLFAGIDTAAVAAGDTVYVTPSGEKYHHANCRLLSQNKSALPLWKAHLLYSPCRLCIAAPITPQTDSSLEQNVKKIATQCIAKTKNGERCKREAELESKYCWQHRPK
jgi:hypothetical protein